MGRQNIMGALRPIMSTEKVCRLVAWYCNPATLEHSVVDILGNMFYASSHGTHSIVIIDMDTTRQSGVSVLYGNQGLDVAYGRELCTLSGLSVSWKSDQYYVAWIPGKVIGP